MDDSHLNRDRESAYSPSGLSDIFTDSTNDSGRNNRSRKTLVKSPPMGRRNSRYLRPDPVSNYIGYHRGPSMKPARPSNNRLDGFSGFRGSMYHKHPPHSIPRAPSFMQRDERPRSFVTSIMSPWSQAAAPSLRAPPVAARNLSMSEKHHLPSYNMGYGKIDDDDANEELEEMMRSRRLRRIITYAAYVVVGLLVILACSLTGYFLSPRTPDIALYGVNSPDSRAKEFKLQGTKMQFHIELVYRVQNDNYFDMVVDGISTAVFWPDTNFALGGGRLSNIKVPSRRVAEIVMPVTIRYDVKRGPPPILLGMVESCGLHDTGVGEMNLEAEIQADFHTKMKQSSAQTGRQNISVRCPVRRMATLQVDDGTSGNIGDIVRTLNA
ncbi:hypothetical protein IW140_001760 [Coemansia sp. RSA 1813]|nr:hypothetical protein EV178_002973 [Coemansia sp. RSA 1646]KAJ1769194.1 hypothetical protein LPJ74_004255 [Coemansia sp. RSA 1843]KAJ2090868.1 hypothetical protein IW138_002271 [Coemansia sp. RSA 986]KAJ2213187.1 hypothetical protein EV179_004062 [Coemansia sp. RSA 487]KAJ2571305.1 hypothetical protein IW140_001760 [Coemansia sp. RSA 1813]